MSAIERMGILIADLAMSTESEMNDRTILTDPFIEIRSSIALNVSRSEETVFVHVDFVVLDPHESKPIAIGAGGLDEPFPR